MRHVSATHVIDCDVDTFWNIFLDEEYTKRFLLDGLGFVSLDVVEHSRGCRCLRAVPKLDWPKPLMKLLGDSFGYEEQGSFDEDKGEWRWKMIPNTLSDKLRTEGSMRVEPAGEGRCRRVNDATIEARIFGIGGLFEGTTEKEIKSAWDKEASFMNRWIATRR